MNPTRGRAGLAAALGIATAVATAAFFIGPFLLSMTPLFAGGVSSNFSRVLKEPRLWAALKFTLMQASASTVLAVVVGMPAAFLIGRRKFPGRRFLSALSAVPFCVPPTIVVLAFVLFYGKEGGLNKSLMAIFGLSSPPVNFLYSFWGVVLAHTFYNFPIAMRVVGDFWALLPDSRANAARLLGAGEIRVFFTITLPSLASAIAAAASLIFLFCYFSFVIVLLFGGLSGGTMEAELYRAARFDLDMPLASALALTESLIALVVLALYAKMASLKPEAATNFSTRQKRKNFSTKKGAVISGIYACALLIFFLGPLLSVLLDSFTVRRGFSTQVTWGLGNYSGLFSTAAFFPALGWTLLIGFLVAFIASLTGFSISALFRLKKSVSLERLLSMLPLAVSGLVIGFGYSLFFGEGSPLLIALAQSATAYPFVLRSVGAVLDDMGKGINDAAALLGATRAETALRIQLPIALPALLSGSAFAFAISAGDVNTILMLPARGVQTLSLLLYRLTGSYRFGEASACAVIIFLLTGIVFFIRDEADRVS